MTCKIFWSIVTIFFLINSTVQIHSQLSNSKYRSLNSQTGVNVLKDRDGGQSEGDHENMFRQERQSIFNLTSDNTNILGNLTGLLGSAGSSTILALAGAPLIKGVVKASLLSLPFHIKEIILRPIILVALLLFLLTGAAYFACNVVNCQNLVGGLGDIGGNGLPLPPLGGSTSYGHGRRNGNDIELFYEKTVRPVLKALENGYKKYK